MMMDDAKTLGTGTLRDLHNVGKSVPYTKFRQMKSTLNCGVERCAPTQKLLKVSLWKVDEPMKPIGVCQALEE